MADLKMKPTKRAPEKERGRRTAIEKTSQPINPNAHLARELIDRPFTGEKIDIGNLDNLSVHDFHVIQPDEPRYPGDVGDHAENYQTDVDERTPLESREKAEYFLERLKKTASVRAVASEYGQLGKYMTRDETESELESRLNTWIFSRRLFESPLSLFSQPLGSIQSQTLMDTYKDSLLSSASYASAELTLPEVFHSVEDIPNVRMEINKRLLRSFRPVVDINIANKEFLLRDEVAMMYIGTESFGLSLLIVVCNSIEDRMVGYFWVPPLAPRKTEESK